MAKIPKIMPNVQDLGGYLVPPKFVKQLLNIVQGNYSVSPSASLSASVSISGTCSPPVGYDYSDCEDILVELQNLVKDSIRSDADMLRIQFLFDLLFGKRK